MHSILRQFQLYNIVTVVAGIPLLLGIVLAANTILNLIAKRKPHALTKK